MDMMYVVGTAQLCDATRCPPERVVEANIRKHAFVLRVSSLAGFWCAVNMDLAVMRDSLAVAFGNWHQAYRHTIDMGVVQPTCIYSLNFPDVAPWFATHTWLCRK